MSDVTASIEKLTKAVTSLTEITVNQHEENRKRFGVIDGHIRALWKRVDGTEPPRGPNGSLPPISLPKKRDPRAEPEDGDGETISEEVTTPIPLDEHVSNHDMNIAALESRVIILDRKFDRVAAHVAKTHHMTEKQSKAMGIDLSFFKYLASKDGIKGIGVIVAAVAAIIAALNTGYANYQQSKQQQQLVAPRVTQAP